MDIKLNEDKLKTLVTEAIFAELTTPESREELIKQAIASLLIPRTQQGTYGSRETYDPLQNAVDVAVSKAAQQILIEEVKNHPQLKEGIKNVVNKVIDSFLNNDAVIEAVAENLGQLIIDSVVRGKRY
ncbi:MAG: hypothetical protein V7K92_28400 [Nostoc sp.]|uniref:hypothetical protein n=1 Tax=Nostoc sp. TaxID=1180 RepID=UPI002FF1D693